MASELLQPFIGRCSIYGLPDRLLVYPNDEAGKQAPFVVVLARYAIPEIGRIAAQVTRDLSPKQSPRPVPHDLWSGLNERLLGRDVFDHPPESETQVSVKFTEVGIETARAYVVKKRFSTSEPRTSERSLAWSDATPEALADVIAGMLDADPPQLEAWRKTNG